MRSLALLLHFSGKASLIWGVRGSYPRTPHSGPPCIVEKSTSWYAAAHMARTSFTSVGSEADSPNTPSGHCLLLAMIPKSLKYKTRI